MLATRYHYDTAVPAPPLLAKRVQAFYQYQRAILTCQHTLASLRAFFVGFRVTHEETTVPCLEGGALSWKRLFVQVGTYLRRPAAPDSTKPATSASFINEPESALFTAWLCSFVLGANASDLDPLQFICAVESWARATDDQLQSSRVMLKTWFGRLAQFIKGLFAWSHAPTSPKYSHLSKPPTMPDRLRDRCTALDAFFQCLLQPAGSDIDPSATTTKLGRASMVVRTHLWIDHQ